MNLYKKLFVSVAGLAMVASLAACGNSPSSGGSNFVDYAHNGSVTLQLDYEGKDFFTDGVGQVTLLRHIDGDTDHFSPVYTTKTGDTTIKSRYYGVDTPESTGRIQPWGLKASKFTKEKIVNANENGTIVVTSTSLTEYKVPGHDSTGERYVSLIWINETMKNAPKEELTLLNLWIVQEGFSDVQGTDDIPEIAPIFFKALKQANKLKLNMWSGDDPDHDTGGYRRTSLLELKQETIKAIKDHSYIPELDGQQLTTPMRVNIIGNVAGYSANTLYIEEGYEVEVPQPDGSTVLETEYASINLYCGPKGAQYAEYYTINTRLSIPCYAQYSEVFGFQLTGAEGHFPFDYENPREDDVHILALAQDNVESSLYTFTYTAEELSTIAGATNDTPNKFESLMCSIKLTTEVVGSTFYINEKGDEITVGFNLLNGSKCNFQLYVTNLNFVCLDPSKPLKKFNTEEDWVGKKFRIDSGVYTYHKTAQGKDRYQIILTGKTSIVWVPEEQQA